MWVPTRLISFSKCVSSVKFLKCYHRERVRIGSGWTRTMLEWKLLPLIDFWHMSNVVGNLIIHCISNCMHESTISKVIA